MINKIKLKDKLKSWLYTLGVASFACALGVCVSMTEKYQKASAYEYQQNGVLKFNDNDFDIEILTSYYFDIYDSQYETDFTLDTYFYGYQNITQVDTYLVELVSVHIFSSDDTLFMVFEDITTDHSIVFSNGGSGFGLDETTDFNFYEYGVFTNNRSSQFYGLLDYTLSYNAPQESGNFVTALTSFMSLIGGGIVQLAQSVGASVVSFASALFIDNGSLSILGGIIGIFAAIAIACGITSKVYTWVSTLGN